MCSLKLTYILVKLHSNQRDYLELRPTKDFFQGGYLYHWHCSDWPAHVNNKKKKDRILVCFIVVFKFAQQCTPGCLRLGWMVLLPTVHRRSGGNSAPRQAMLWVRPSRACKEALMTELTQWRPVSRSWTCFVWPVLLTSKTNKQKSSDTSVSFGVVRVLTVHHRGLFFFPYVV